MPEENICKVIDGVPHIYPMEKRILKEALESYLNSTKKSLEDNPDSPGWMRNIVEQGIVLAEVVKARLDAMPEVVK